MHGVFNVATATCGDWPPPCAATSSPHSTSAENAMFETTLHTQGRLGCLQQGHLAGGYELVGTNRLLRRAECNKRRAGLSSALQITSAWLPHVGGREAGLGTTSH